METIFLKNKLQYQSWIEAFGDGVYELIPVYSSKIFCRQTFTRLRSSLNTLAWIVTLKYMI